METADGAGSVSNRSLFPCGMESAANSSANRLLKTNDRTGANAWNDRATETSHKGIKAHGDVQKQWVYLADVAQRRHEENAKGKGRNLKIGSDHRLADSIERKIKDEKYAPGAVIGDLMQHGWPSDVRICVKTLYNYIDRGLFPGINHEELPFKKKRTKPTTHR